MLGKPLSIHQYPSSSTSTCYSMWQKMLRSLIIRERRNDSNRVSKPCKENQTHTHGEQKSPTQYLSFLSCPWIRVTPLDYRVWLLCTRMLRSSWTKVQKRVEVKSTRWSNLVLKITNYHISRHVASTFKSLTSVPHTATLAFFHYTDRVTSMNNNT